jgi:hypothetical protein
MQVSYGEGLASRTGSESCVDVCEDVVEALTGVRVGWVLSPENVLNRSADGLRPSEGNTGRIAIARFNRAPRGLRPHARPEAPHKGGESLPSGSREAPDLARRRRVRTGNPKGARR